MKGNVKRNIFIAIIFTIIFYIGLAFYGNFDLVILSLQNFKWQYLPIILIIIYATFLLKFIKWHYYLSLVDVHIKFSISFHIFMSSLTMSVTPGKIGDLIKPYMIKEIDGTPISKTVPIVFAERVTEFSSLILIILLGIKIFEMDILIVFFTLTLFLLGLIIVLNKNANRYIIDKLSNFKVMNRYIEAISISLNHSRNLLKIKPFLLMFLLSIVIWLLESFGFYLILLGFSEILPIFNSFFTYLFSVFAGSVAMIPAGLGITDGSITYLLGKEGIKSDVAISIALIARITILWFSLLIGTISLANFNKITNTNNTQKKL